MEEAERILVEQAAAGDETAFAHLMEAHKDMVYTLCFRTLGNAHDAEEVFQDAFLSAYRNLPNFRGESKVATWLYRIALNRCRDFMESRKSRQARETVSIDCLQRPLAAASSDGAFDAKSILEQAMPLLSEEYRSAINLHCIMGYSYDEAGEIMGVPGGTVKTYVHRGKAALREVLSAGRTVPADGEAL